MAGVAARVKRMEREIFNWLVEGRSLTLVHLAYFALGDQNVRHFEQTWDLPLTNNLKDMVFNFPARYLTPTTFVDYYKHRVPTEFRLAIRTGNVERVSQLWNADDENMRKFFLYRDAMKWNCFNLRTCTYLLLNVLLKGLSGFQKYIGIDPGYIGYDDEQELIDIQTSVISRARNALYEQYARQAVFYEREAVLDKLLEEKRLGPFVIFRICIEYGKHELGLKYVPKPNQISTLCLALRYRHLDITGLYTDIELSEINLVHIRDAMILSGSADVVDFVEHKLGISSEIFLRFFLEQNLEPKPVEVPSNATVAFLERLKDQVKLTFDYKFVPKDTDVFLCALSMGHLVPAYRYISSYEMNPSLAILSLKSKIGDVQYIPYADGPYNDKFAKHLQL